MQAFFHACRQLGDEFVRVLDELAAEEGERPAEKQPSAETVLLVQSKLTIAALHLRHQSDLNVLVQHFAPSAVQRPATGTPGEELDAGFLYHFFLQLNYLHDSDWILFLSEALAVGPVELRLPLRMEGEGHISDLPLRNLTDSAIDRLRRLAARFYDERRLLESSKRYCVGCAFKAHVSGARELVRAPLCRLPLLGVAHSSYRTLLTPCQWHRLFRESSPRLLWTSAEVESGGPEWKRLPRMGIESPVVLVLRTTDLDVFGCILSEIPAAGVTQTKVKSEKDAPSFISFFTFSPTFQFLDVEAATVAATSGPSASIFQGNTAAYFMSLGEGDPPSLGRLEGEVGEKRDGREGDERFRSPLNEVALSVDRPQSGGITICARFKVPTTPVDSEADALMVVVLDIDCSGRRCRVAAKSTLKAPSFHFDVAASAGTGAGGTGSEDDRHSVEISAMEWFHIGAERVDRDFLLAKAPQEEPPVAAREARPPPSASAAPAVQPQPQGVGSGSGGSGPTGAKAADDYEEFVLI